MDRTRINGLLRPVLAAVGVVCALGAVVWLVWPRPPNLLVIVADDIGVERLAALDQPHAVWPATPTIDGLAKRGLVFERAYANPVCTPTRAAALTGRYVRRRGAGHAILADSTYELPIDDGGIPNVLRPAGYTSIALGKWHLSNEISPSSFDHPLLFGFDHHTGFLQRNNYVEWRRTVDGKPGISKTYATRATTDALIEAANTTQEPWFIWAAYQSAHAPIHVPPKRLNPRGVKPNAPGLDKWHAMIEALDMELGRALESIDPAVLDNTVVVFFGDNGSIARFMPPGWQPSGGKGAVAESGIRVPLIVSGPGVRVGRTDALVNIVDLLPTLADLAGVDPGMPSTVGGWDRDDPQPKSGSRRIVIDGASFAETLRSEAPSARRYSYSEAFYPIGAPPYRRDDVALRDERYKIRRRNGELFFHDLQGRHDDGPNLVASLTPEQQEAFDRLQRVLERHRVALKYEP